ncbi:unnamed protein product, partial [Iphiclides podalirius]
MQRDYIRSGTWEGNAEYKGNDLEIEHDTAGPDRSRLYSTCLLPPLCDRMKTDFRRKLVDTNHPSPSTATGTDCSPITTKSAT